MPQNWYDKYVVEDKFPGTSVETTPKGSNWYDKYVVEDKHEAKKDEGFNWKGMARDVALSGALQMATGPALPISMVTQGAYGAGSSIYDAVQEKGVKGINKEDLLNALIKGGVSSLGPLGSRILSPMLPKVIPKPSGAVERGAVKTASKEGVENLSDDVIEHMARQGRLDVLTPHVPELSKPVRQIPEFLRKGAEHVASNTPNVVLGGVLGGAFGNPLLGMAGGYAANNAPKAVSAWWNNSIMHHPIQQAIMNELARESGQQGTDMIKY